MTQEQLADAAGVHPTQVSNIETGKRNPRFLTIMKLAEALDVKAVKLWEGVG